MPFDPARYNLPNLAAVVAMALMPLVALPMHRHSGVTAKAQPIQIEAADQETAANVAYAIFD